MNPDITEIRPILLILGCHKYQEFLMAATLRMEYNEAWRIIAIMGTREKEKEYKFDGTVLILPVNDNYESIPSKMYAAFEWINTYFPNSPGIWKTDDDIVFTDLKKLHTVIQENKDKLYWGIVTKRCKSGIINIKRIMERFENKTFRPEYQMSHYCFGLGYWINRSVLEYILDAKKEYEQSYLEDVCTGYILNKKGIQPLMINSILYSEFPRNELLLTLSSKSNK